MHDDWTQRLYSRLPEVYRLRDIEQGRLRAAGGDDEQALAVAPLLGLLRAVGGSVTAVHQDLEQLWDDFFIETCDDWVVPYLGRLLGTNLPANPIGQANRLDVRSTVSWRRSKGAPAMLRSLAAATTGWQVSLAEFFTQIAWVQNLDFQRPGRTLTPRGARPVRDGAPRPRRRSLRPHRRRASFRRPRPGAAGRRRGRARGAEPSGARRLGHAGSLRPQAPRDLRRAPGHLPAARRRARATAAPGGGAPALVELRPARPRRPPVLRRHARAARRAHARARPRHALRPRRGPVRALRRRPARDATRRPPGGPRVRARLRLRHPGAARATASDGRHAPAGRARPP